MLLSRIAKKVRAESWTVLILELVLLVAGILALAYDARARELMTAIDRELGTT